jgi:hypothetical protein
VLSGTGFPAPYATTAVVAGAIIDLALGLTVLHRRLASLSLSGMILTSLAYLAGASLWRPDLWLDPLGVLAKVLPGIALAACLLAVMEER